MLGLNWYKIGWNFSMRELGYFKCNLHWNSLPTKGVYPYFTFLKLASHTQRSVWVQVGSRPRRIDYSAIICIQRWPWMNYPSWYSHPVWSQLMLNLGWPYDSFNHLRVVEVMLCHFWLEDFLLPSNKLLQLRGLKQHQFISSQFCKSWHSWVLCSVSQLKARCWLG